MVKFATLFATAVIFSSRVLAVPLPDSSINEPGVRSPDGTPITDPAAEPTPMGNYNYNPETTTTEKMMDTTTEKMMENTSTEKPMKETTTMMMEKPTETEKPMKETTTMMKEETTSTMMEEQTTTTESPSTTTQYGSGYNNWNNGYNDCVQQCMNTYGAPPSMYTPPPSDTTTEGGDGGSGKTINVMVAPAQGILRFVPFAVNASAGDTIHFIWGGSPHTVTKSSTILPCNKSLDSETFTSGVQNKSFTFDLKVNDTNTIAYYCGVPGHCPKGMFAYINPPNANPTSTTTNVAAMMPALISNNTDLATQAMYVANKTMGTSAYTWGDNIDMADVPSELHVSFMQNVLQTRLTLAANPGMLEGGMGATNTNGQPVTIPSDVTQISAATDPSAGTPSSSAPAGVGATPSGGSSAAPSETGTPSGSSKTGGAMGKNVASSAAIGLAVLVAFIAL